IHDGIAIYQSSFEDGGSHLTLTAHPFGQPGASFQVKGDVGAGATLTNPASGEKLQLEFTGLRVINVENMAGAEASGADVRGVDLAASLSKHLGSGAHGGDDKQLHNVGPSVSYKLRDAAGQAREYQNYMAPVELDGLRVFLVGVRDTPDQGFRFLRIPADDQGGMADFLRLRAALADPKARGAAATQYARQSTPADRPQLTEQIRASAERALALFAGAEAGTGQAGQAGLFGLQTFVEANVPEAERARMSEVLIRILNGGLFELLNQARGQAGLAALQPSEPTQKFMTAAVLSLSDSLAYPAPLLLTLKDFQQVQASVFQLTRSPGKKLVYLGCGFLMLGVFVMLYVRERRLWIWLEGAPDAARTGVTLALSVTRQSLDTDREFESLRNELLPPEAPA
ncbi:MAG: hypothetical protein RLY71_3737, partial [Pseudomonadota bacterium]